ncbi:diacylglycerol kinase family protein [Arthrobacter sp. LAPM80]|uniref:diacylglycerol/lipid kinase family protein n=1 Tax=Arthrobacter sp. LAPM80 TaxID=3141788 RepID=UPI00398B4F4D
MAENPFPQARRSAVVINPLKSPDEEFKRTVFQLCTDAGWAEPLWLETTEEDPGRGQAKEALAAGVDVVIAAGGDGTVRYVAEVLTDTATALGVVPLGTGNLLARNLGIPVTDPVAAVREVLSGAETKIDVMKAMIDHSGQEQIFLVAAGLGYDASIMADTIDGLKDRVGWLAYIESGLRNLPGKPVTAKITVDGRDEAHRKVRGVMVGNCGKLMGGVEIFPDASVTDGLMDILTLAPQGKFGWLAVILGVFGKNSKRNQAVQSLSGTTAEISLDRPQEFQLDGDHLGPATHLRVTVAPQVLTIRMTTLPS